MELSVEGFSALNSITLSNGGSLSKIEGRVAEPEQTHYSHSRGFLAISAGRSSKSGDNRLSLFTQVHCSYVNWTGMTGSMGESAVRASSIVLPYWKY
jgi:hypothetical protein